MSREDERQRRSSYFPNAALNKGYSLDSRFMGGLQPSSTGSYYNPSRYAGEGFSQQQQNRIQSNLATNYTKDQEFNRLANPNYQTTQDTGYGSTDQFGSGRSSAATTQQYALKYGTPAGNGLSTFQTPSGGSITYRPTGRKLSGGAEPTVSPGSADLRQPLAQMEAIQSGAYEKGFGAPVYPQQQPPLTPGQFVNNIPGYIVRAPTKLAGAVGTLAYNAYNSLFGGAGNQYANPSQNATPGATPQTGRDSQYFAYNPSPAPPRRYFDY